MKKHFQFLALIYIGYSLKETVVSPGRLQNKYLFYWSRQ